MKLERKPVRGAIIATVITLLGGFLYFYFALPALNIHNLDAYVFLAVLIIAWCSLYAMFSHSVTRGGMMTGKRCPRIIWMWTKTAMWCASAIPGAGKSWPCSA